VTVDAHGITPRLKDDAEQQPTACLSPGTRHPKQVPPRYPRIANERQPVNQRNRINARSLRE